MDRERCRLDALGLRAVAELRERRLAEHSGLAPADVDDPAQLTADQVLATELCAALRIGSGTAHARITSARELTEDLPATLDAYAAGAIHFGHVAAVRGTSALLAERLVTADGTDGDPLYADDALRRARAELEKTCLVGVERLSRAQLARRLKRFLARAAGGHVLTVAHARQTTPFLRVEPCDDGVNAHVSGFLPLAEGLRLDAYLDGCADATHPEDPRGVDAEGRTHARRRVDAFLDSVSAARAGSSAAPTAQVHVTVAATTLLGLDDDPAEVVTPTSAITVTADVARDLAADATWRRILTDPVGAVLDVGARTYRPSADVARRVRARSTTCVFPGCVRPAQHCDLDHVTPFAQGGETTVDNLAPECRHHHRVKTHTRWRLRRRDRGWRWTSPTGHTYDTDDEPPPY
nr:HNH endonuclease signature motif containing protein [Kineococcus siccus]